MITILVFSHMLHIVHKVQNQRVNVKASDLLVKCLESEGVEYIFGLPGEENADLMMSLSNSKIKFILTRHEQEGFIVMF